MKHLSAIGMSILFVLHGITARADAEDYFPLNAGNAWYMSSGSMTIIGDQVSIDDTLYYEVRDLENVRVHYRMDAAGDVYQRELDGPEAMLYRMGADVGTEWLARTSPTAPAFLHLTIESETDTIGTYAGRFTDCRKIVWRGVQIESDSTITIGSIARIDWFAPNVGLVRTDLSRSSNYLYLAKIDGTVYSLHAQPLHLFTTIPHSNQTDVERDSRITLEFSRDINIEQATGQAIRVTSNIRGTLTGTLGRDARNSKIVIFQPDEPFRYGETIEVTASMEIEDYFDFRLEEPYRFTFAIRPETRPEIVFRADSISVMTDLVWGDFDWADYDHDGDYDLVVAGHNFLGPDIDSTTELFTNNGNRFAQQMTEMIPIELSTARGRGAVLFMDFNGDDLEDLVYTGNDTARNTRTVFYANTANGFGSTIAHDFDFECIAMDCADLDGDGFDELAVWRSNTDENLALVNSEYGEIRYNPLQNPELMNTGIVKMIQCGGDNAPDLVVAGSHLLRVFINSGGFLQERMFSPPGTPSFYDRLGIDAADADDDGNIDLLIGASLFLWDGATYRMQRVTDLRSAIFPEFNDFDGDGDMDIFIVGKEIDAVGNEWTSFQLLENSDGVFSVYDVFRADNSLMGSTGQWIDLDGNGHPDFTTIGPRGFIIWYNELDIPGTPVNVDTTAPESAALAAYPNPFNASTTIAYILDEPGHVSISVYSVNGQRISTLIDSSIPAGTHRVMWNGLSENGIRCASGIYLIQARYGERMQVCKIQLLK